MDPSNSRESFINPWSEIWTAERASDIKIRDSSFAELKVALQNRRTVTGSLQYYDWNF